MKVLSATLEVCVVQTAFEVQEPSARTHGLTSLRHHKSQTRFMENTRGSISMKVYHEGAGQRIGKEL